MKSFLDSHNYRIEYNYHAILLQILNERSSIVFNGRIFHEAIKGLVNDKRYMGFKDKVFKDANAQFVRNIMDFAYDFIWIPRCKEVV